MSSDHSENVPTGDLPPITGNPTLSAVRRSTAISAGRLWLLALAAGIAAGLLSWLGGEGGYDHFVPVSQEIKMHGSRGKVVDPAAQFAADARNAALAFAILGGVLGGALGLAGGLARGHAKTGLRAGGLGLVLGIITGAGGGFGMTSLYDRFYNPDLASLITPLMIHGAIWGILGAVAGLALGMGMGSQIAKALVGGILGAFLGTVIFEVVGATVFPLDRTFQPLSTSAYSRLAARMAICLFVAMGAVIVSQTSDRTAKATPRSVPQ